MWVYNDANVLIHYGIKGMKWGVIRFRDKDGKSRYGVDYDKAKSNLDKATAVYLSEAKNPVYSAKDSKKIRKSQAAVNYHTREVSDAKHRAKMVGTKKSKRQEKYEQEYKKQGLTKDEAELAAYKKIKTQKMIAVTAGVTLTAATAYVAYKHYDNNVDKILKSGTLLQNISTNSNKGVSDAFYASKGSMDKIKYKGLYGSQLKAQNGGSIYKTDVRVKNNLRVASKQSATQALAELIKKDDGSKDAVVRQVGLVSRSLNEKQRRVAQKALQSIASGKVDSNVYDAFNIALVDHSPYGESINKRFYSHLKAKGYDAIKDVNDAKYSGYKTNPLIVFGGTNRVTVDKVREVVNSEIDKNRNIAMMDLVGRQGVAVGAIYTASILGGTAVGKSAKTKKNNAIVSQYRKAHPESKLTYNEIVRNYES